MRWRVDRGNRKGPWKGKAARHEIREISQTALADGLGCVVGRIHGLWRCA
jgi:hypothetical protein